MEGSEMSEGWSVKVPSSNPLALFADWVMVDNSGCLHLSRKDGGLVAIFAPGQWLSVFPLHREEGSDRPA